MSSQSQWWKKGEAQSIAKRTRQVEATSGVKAGDSFLIVTEGTVTEPIYFKLLRQDLQLGPVTIRIEPGDHSDPRHVIRTADRIVKEHANRRRRGKLGQTEPQNYDHVWAVIDTDVAVRTNIWNDVVHLAEGRKVRLAHSSPCFEFWLLLHVEYTTRADLITGKDAKGAVKAKIGYDYSTNVAVANEAMKSIISQWPQAVTNAERVREHHLGASTPIPANPSSEICALVRALDGSSPRHLRKL